MEGSKLYTNVDSCEKKFEPSRNDDRANTYNQYILQFWRANVDWQPVLSRHAVIKYIAKYASKVERSSEKYQQMLMCLSNLSNPNNLASWAYRNLLTKTIIERDIGAQETCHMLLELPLVEYSRKFVNLNFSHEVFKPVVINDDINEDDLTIFCC